MAASRRNKLEIVKFNGKLLDTFILAAETQRALANDEECLAGYTDADKSTGEKLYKLRTKKCDEQLPAVCYNWRQTAKTRCDAADGWFLHHDGIEWEAFRKAKNYGPNAKITTKDRDALPPRCYKVILCLIPTLSSFWPFISEAVLDVHQ